MTMPEFPWEADASEADASEAKAEAEAEADAENKAEAEAGHEVSAAAPAEAAAPGPGREAGQAARPPQPEPQPKPQQRPDPRPLIKKEYYAISEVADLVGLPAHVLRYWESQFAVLNPSKNRSGNRVYQRKEIKLIMLVKQLLHDEKYTVEGAKQKLEQLRRGGGTAGAVAHALDTQMVGVLRDELQALDELLRVDGQ
jgi:DNA-binding transcriptional MerR regulator